MLRTALASILVLALVPSLQAQTCGGGQTLMKNDVLPANPGQQTVSVIPGLCEGEAAGCVFDVSGLGSAVKVNLAAIGFIDANGAGGQQAIVNLKIYDGISWAGGIPTLGTEVLDYAQLTGNLIGVQASAINTFDISQLNITISSGKLVVTWWMDTNPNGSCAGGYPVNFATDYNTGPANCNVHQKNLLYILGQGWRDASTATVQGFQLCPLYYAGNWLIRSCVQPAGNTQAFCFGDGTLQTACPCNNNGAGGQGCENSASTGGALLTVAGTTNPDTIVLTSSGELPSPLSIFLQGPTQSTTGVVFGDGVRCVTGSLKRLYIHNASGGVVSAPVGADLPITTRSANLGDTIPPGGIRYYQVYYRDPSAVFCPAGSGGGTFNASGGMKITW